MPTHALLVDDENSGSQDFIQICEATRNFNDGSFEVDDLRDRSVAFAWLPRNEKVEAMSFLLFIFLQAGIWVSNLIASVAHEQPTCSGGFGCRLYPSISR